MTSLTLNWLKTSLFYDRQCIGDLFKNGIKPFLSIVIEKELIQGYTIELSSVGGEHVKFSLLTNQDNAQALAKCVDHHFKAYFLKKPASKKQLDDTFHDIFSRFPPNTIQYGLYDLVEITSEDEKNTYNISFLLSDILIEENLIDNNNSSTIFSIGFYMHLALILGLVKSEMGDACLTNFFINLSKQPNSKMLETKFHASKDLVLDMFNDVIEYAKQRDHFISRWMTACEGELVLSNSKTGVLSKFEFIRRVINKQLNINQFMSDFISFCHNECLANKIVSKTNEIA